MTDIERLHHAAYRCRDSEETRAFYEDFLGLKLVNALTIATQGSEADVLHTFYAMNDDSCLAFFEEPKADFDFKAQRDFDLHIALQVNKETLLSMMDKGRAEGIETRGIADHGFIESIYFRDPNGYVVELSAPKEDKPLRDIEAANKILNDWQETKQVP
ncbi:MAG TPA: VOC family protein [Gammaproteobacteria bacterium]|nr:lactoylglutathione lyase [Gammaproteobacteria bacterium]HAK52364.1 VOC family protein [Gammaproteobacteria bacterium]|tara:strand:+ start:1469 stop:1945 length:477 start_codon:yes stop_codon:yes gene_type:complete